MKRISLSLALLLALASCGGNGEAADENKNDSPQPAAAEQTETATDATTEKEAPQSVSLKLKTTGETMSEMAFEPKRLEAPAGAKVTLTLENKATAQAMVHNAVFIQKGAQEEVMSEGMEAGKEAGFVGKSDKIIAASALAKPGETVTLSFTAPSEPGTYQYICTYPGHASMKGIFLVR